MLPPPAEAPQPSPHPRTPRAGHPRSVGTSPRTPSAACQVVPLPEHRLPPEPPFKPHRDRPGVHTLQDLGLLAAHLGAADLGGQGSGPHGSCCSGRGSPRHWLSGRISSPSGPPWARAQYRILRATPPPQLTLQAASLYCHLANRSQAAPGEAGPISPDREGPGQGLSPRVTFTSPPRGRAQRTENTRESPFCRTQS